MANRLTDSGKWAKPFFCELSMKMKLVWFYLLDNCDHAGLWDINLALLEFHIGDPVTLSEIKESFGDKIIHFEDKLWIPGFVEFQQKCTIDELNPNNNAQKGIISRLKKVGAYEPLKSPTLRGTGKGKGLGKGLGKGKKEPLISEKDLEEIYAEYPRKQGKTRGFKKLKSILSKTDSLNEVKQAAINYTRYCQSKKIDSQYIQLFSTWVSEWEDWKDPMTGTSQVQQNSGSAYKAW